MEDCAGGISSLRSDIPAPCGGYLTRSLRSMLLRCLFRTRTGLSKLHPAGYAKALRIFIRRASCDPGGIRTHDPQLRRLLLYPTELPDPLFGHQKQCPQDCKVPVFFGGLQKYGIFFKTRPLND